VRDTQRQRLYDAEQQILGQLAFAAAGARTVEAAGSTLTVPLELRFGTLRAVQDYVAALQASAGFAALFPRAAGVPLTIRRRAGGRAAHYEPPGTIALHEGGHSLRELVVLHEVAHHGQHHDLPPGPAHGPAFASALTRLVGLAVGPEVELLLTVALAEHGVSSAVGEPA
jgi:putative metallohydrolase (TIGR04338 family)